MSSLASLLYTWRMRAWPSPDENRRDAAADEREMEPQLTTPPAHAPAPPPRARAIPTQQQRPGKHRPQHPTEDTMTDPLARLRAAGVSVWLDDLSRDRLISGSLGALARDKHVSGVTTNPTIFARSIIDSNAYTGQLRDLRVRQAAPDQALRELTTSDVRCACDVLRTVYDATEGVDGRVSIEVDPRFAYDPERTVAEARTLWWLVDRPNLFVKIPAVKQGLPAISGCLAEGISINVTLIFSLARYAEVIEAFLTGLEGARGAGRDLSGIDSVASQVVRPRPGSLRGIRPSLPAGAARSNAGRGTGAPAPTCEEPVTDIAHRDPSYRDQRSSRA